MILLPAFFLACLPFAASQILPLSSPLPPGMLVAVPTVGAVEFTEVQFRTLHAFGPSENATHNWVRVAHEGLPGCAHARRVSEWRTANT